MTPLHYIGEWLRETLAQIPMPIVRVLFLALPVALLIWVLRLPNKQTTPPDRVARWDENLKVWAAVALVMQMVIYALL